MTHVPEFCAGNVGLNLDYMDDDIVLQAVEASTQSGGPLETMKCVTAHPSRLPMCVSISLCNASFMT